MTVPRNHPNEPDEQEGSHWVPCSEHVRLRESYLTFRAIVYGVACIFASIAAYLWLRIDHFQEGALERALAIVELRQTLGYLQEGQSRIEAMLQKHMDLDTTKPQAGIGLGRRSADLAAGLPTDGTY